MTARLPLGSNAWPAAALARISQTERVAQEGFITEASNTLSKNAVRARLILAWSKMISMSNSFPDI